MTTAIESTHAVMAFVYDPSVDTSGVRQSFWESPTYVPGEHRLRSEESLRSVGFSFLENKRTDLGASYKVDPLVTRPSANPAEIDLRWGAPPQIEDGIYVLKDQRQLLPSSHTVKEKLNNSGVFTIGAWHHRSEYPFDPSKVDVRLLSRIEDDIVYEAVSEFSLLPGETAYRNANVIDFSKINGYKPQFKPCPLAPNQELELTQFVTKESLIEANPTSTEYWNHAWKTSVRDGTRVEFPFYPLETAEIFSFSGGSLQAWTATTDNSFGNGDRLYWLDDLDGKAYLNPGASLPSEVILGWRAVPRVHYALEHRWRGFYDAVEAPLGRVVEDVRRGSYFLTLSPESTAGEEVLFGIEGGTSHVGHWRQVYFSDTSTPCSIRVMEQGSQEGKANVPVQIRLLGKGKVIGSTNGYTDDEGWMRFRLQPPSYKDGFVYFDGTGSSITTTAFAESTSTSQQYIYSIWQNDPIVGTSIDRMRKVILHTYSTNYYDPVTNSTGAFHPLHPVAISGTHIALEEVLPSNAWIHSFAALGPVFLPIEISTPQSTTTERILCTFRPSQEGDVLIGGQKYPMGWRIPAPPLYAEWANTLDAALYFTVNPYSGEHTILFSGGTARTLADGFGLSYIVATS